MVSKSSWNDLHGLQIVLELFVWSLNHPGTIYMVPKLSRDDLHGL